MGPTGSFGDDRGQTATASASSGGLLDVLGVAAVLLDAEGRIVLWSPQAEDLFGHSAEEAVGQYAGRLLVRKDQVEVVLDTFARVMAGGGSWAGVFPVRHKDGSTLLVEFRNMRLQDDQGDYYALGLATDQATVRQVERDLALSARLVTQTPIGLGVLDTDLRYVSVNPAEERMNGVPAAEHVGRHVHEVLPFLDPSFEGTMRKVLATGTPVSDQYTVGRTPADPDNEHAWSISFHRLEAPNGEVLGVVTSSVDVTERHRAVEEQRRTVLTLQRSLLPHPPPQRPGLAVASRYQPAQAASEIGGDWFDVIALGGDKTALVVGDVMGSGVSAAATMGQLRTATRTLAGLDLDPAQVFQHLDHITEDLQQETIATCVYAVYDPHSAQCHVSLAGHLPPVLLHPDGKRELLDLPTGAPLGGCGVAFDTTRLDFAPGDQLVLYTDGLVETRDQPIDARLDTLLEFLDDPTRSLDDTCDLLLDSLRHPGVHDDVALLIARAGPWPAGAPRGPRDWPARP
ncbi:PAS domain S-box-containing protein [Streptomyces sp. SLBN-118]|uniref:SpoIIE family protein phosphatase n=1 Tax=Streptomyces sp. SLBN-118 TaxID=2768454 RepID=UPI00114EE0B4|nr:SpoIIE family protein phosphatase [Streptomyces sp. SLBN-118]TQK42739.1 PAS domain S-box-containing protein [Streptomyces sp. SLBN-118]